MNENDKARYRKYVLIALPLSVIGLLVLGWTWIMTSAPRRGPHGDDDKPSKTWTIEDLNKLAGAELNTRDWTIKDVKCTRAGFKGEAENNYQRVYYFLFDSEKDAKEAFKLLKEKGLNENGMEVTENTLYGYEKDVCDADIECFYLITGNLLVETEGVYGNYYDINDEEKVQAANKKESEEFQELKAWIPQNFD